MSTNPGFENDEEGVDVRDGTRSPINPNLPNAGNGSADSTKKYSAALAKQAKREQTPLMYCRWVTKWPKLTFAISLCTHLSFLLITIILIQVGYDIIPIVFERIPLDITDDVDYLRGQAWAFREDAPGIVSRMGNSVVETERSAIGDIYTSFYEIEGNGGNVFTKENLKLMQETEDELWGEKEFQEKLCWLRAGACVKPKSVMRYFDGTYKQANPTLFRDYSGDGDAMFDNYLAVLFEATSNDATREEFEWFLGKESAVIAESAVSSITRTQWMFGLPYEGYKNSTDREEEQLEHITAYLKDVLTPAADKHYSNKIGAMFYVYSSFRWLGISISGQVFKDMALAGGSLLFIIFFVSIQTGSLWITCFSILSIITSFCCANIIYRCIFDYRYFGIFHVLAIFIILGIGADDIFIFLDTWKATGHHRYPSLAHRLSDTYRKAAMAMLFTSLTTAMAFVVSSTSPFLGIYTFGLFAAWLVIVNYISVILFFPTVVIMYHTYFEKYKCCCCCPGTAGSAGGALSGGQPSSINGSETNKQSPQPGPVVVATDSPRKPSVSSTFADTHKRIHFVVRFFRGPYFKFVTHRIWRWVILAFFIIVICVFIGFATQIKVNEEQTKFLPDNTNTGRYLAKSSIAFRGNDRLTQVSIVWGLREQDLSSCHRTEVDCPGETVWDNNFDMNSATAQRQLKSFCEHLRNLSDDKIEELHIKRNLITQEPEVDCFIEKMEIFYAEEEDRMQLVLPLTNPSTTERRYPAGTQLDLPWTDDNVVSILNNVDDIYDSSALIKPDFKDYFEIAASFWLYNGFQAASFGEQFREYSGNLGEAAVDGETIELVIPRRGFNLTYSYGTRLRYMAITVNTTINGRILGYPEGLPIRDVWESTVSAQIEKMDKGLQGGFQVTSGAINLWHWLKVQQRLVSSAAIGIAIGLCLAFPILVVATGNIIVGSLATLIIVIITVSVIGVIPMAGWKLGLLESLNLVLVVGLAVDYVVHLAEGYSRSEHRDRLGRLHDALDEVGISVLSGAITTLGSSFFLLLAQILFFKQFGIFMFSTIGLSISYSLGLFVVILGIFGPENDTGSLRSLFGKCCKVCRKDDESPPAAADNNMQTFDTTRSPAILEGTNKSNNSNQSNGAEKDDGVRATNGDIIRVEAFKPVVITFDSK